MQRFSELTGCRRKSLLTGLASLLALALAAAAHLGHWPISDWSLGLLTGFGVGGIFAAALLWFMPDTSDAVPRELSRRYLRDIAPAMVGYVAVMLVWKRLLGAVELPLLRVLIALLPAFLLVWMMRAFVRYVRDCDEMQRRIELESGAVAALVLCTGYMTLGFLQTAALINIPATVAMLWVFPALCFSYGLVKVVIARRYG
jgi:hypothetical protein